MKLESALRIRRYRFRLALRPCVSYTVRSSNFSQLTLRFQLHGFFSGPASPCALRFTSRLPRCLHHGCHLRPTLVQHTATTNATTTRIHYIHILQRPSSVQQCQPRREADTRPPISTVGWLSPAQSASSFLRAYIFGSVSSRTPISLLSSYHHLHGSHVSSSVTSTSPPRSRRKTQYLRTKIVLKIEPSGRVWVEGEHTRSTA